jgi:hypothetical protein
VLLSSPTDKRKALVVFVCSVPHPSTNRYKK